MTLLRSILTVLFVLVAVCQPVSVIAATCTDDEQSTIIQIYTDLTNSTACAELMSNSDATSLDYCMNSDCVSELSAAVDELPDCTSDDDINRKTGLQTIVTYCADTTELMDQSTSGSRSDTVSSASRSFLAAGGLVAQLSVGLYFFVGLL